MDKHFPILSKAQTTQFRGLKLAKHRRQEGLFLVEGVRLCEELFRSELKIDACITGKGFDKLSIPEDLTHFEATPTQIQQISDSKSPQGIICIAHIPQELRLPPPKAGKVLLVLDRMADPGNMGTIFRSALWFGVQDILLGPECVDPFSPKAIRASMGATAYLNIHFSGDLKISALDWKSAGGEVGALHMAGNNLEQYQPREGLFLIVGSESHGVASELLNLSTPLSITKTGQGESLNAAMATGIALYEISRERDTKH